jgi:hypothetical protein
MPESEPRPIGGPPTLRLRLTRLQKCPERGAGPAPHSAGQLALVSGASGGIEAPPPTSGAAYGGVDSQAPMRHPVFGIEARPRIR